MELDFIKDLNKEDLCKLIDLIEGMPPEIVGYIRINMSKPDFYNKILSNNTVLLNSNNTLEKYLGKKINVKHVSASSAMLQSMYSDVLMNIDNMKSIPNKVKSKIKMLLNMPSYDDESIVNLETSIISIIDEVDWDEPALFELLYFINTKLMPYKIMVHDFYSYLSLCNSHEYVNYNFNSSDCNHLTDIHDLLIKLIYNNKISYIDYNNIASLIYAYFKEIGISSVVEKYNLLCRFLTPLERLLYKEDINTIREFIFDKINSDMPAGDNIHNLLDIKMPLKEIVDTKLNADSIAKEIDSFIVSFKDSNLVPDINDMEKFRLRLSVLNNDTISQYIDISKNYNIFSLSENDICYLRDIKDIKLGNVYDVDCGMKYLIYYNDELYLLFKNNINTTIIYGISLNKNLNGDRKIIEIKKSPNMTYKYISTI